MPGICPSRSKRNICLLDLKGATTAVVSCHPRDLLLYCSTEAGGQKNQPERVKLFLPGPLYLPIFTGPARYGGAPDAASTPAARRPDTTDLKIENSPRKPRGWPVGEGCGKESPKPADVHGWPGLWEPAPSANAARCAAMPGSAALR